MTDNSPNDPWAAAEAKKADPGNFDDPWATAAPAVDNFFIIVVQNIDETQRRLVHALVKRKSKDWWHEMFDVWIVRGGSIRQWLNDLNIIVTGQEQDTCLVFALPKPGERNLGMVIPNTAKEWLVEVYSKNGTLKPPKELPKKVATKVFFDDEPPF